MKTLDNYLTGVPAVYRDNMQRVYNHLLEIERSFQHQFVISSFFRSVAKNALVHGNPKSQHLTGSAIDFVCPTSDTLTVWNYIKQGFVYDQLILEEKIVDGKKVVWVHLSLIEKGNRMMAFKMAGL